MYTLPMDEIDFESLILVLSQKPHYPLSMHLRNHLIAAYSAQHTPPDASKQDPWTTYRKYRRGVQLIAIGDVPASVNKRPGDVDFAKRDGLWGIAILFPTETSVGREEYEDEKEEGGHIWHSMRLHLWLSSETLSKDKVNVDNVKVATKQEEELLHYLLNNFLQTAIQRLILERGSSDNTKTHEVDLFAINEAWVQVMRKWTREGKSCIQLTRANPCMTFIRSEANSIDDIDIAPRWHIDVIKGEDEVKLVRLSPSFKKVKKLKSLLQVQSANSLRFPLWYIEQRKHISILIRDGHHSIDSEYPTSIKPGSPAAWAYAHDDLSLASLHVAEPYRRTGLGRICVDLMGKKLIQAQKEALAKCCSSSDIDIPTPFLLDTEMHKGASRLFFEAQGFNGIVVATWGSLLVTSPSSDDPSF